MSTIDGEEFIPIVPRIIDESMKEYVPDEDIDIERAKKMKSSVPPPKNKDAPPPQGQKKKSSLVKQITIISLIVVVVVLIVILIYQVYKYYNNKDEKGEDSKSDDKKEGQSSETSGGCPMGASHIIKKTPAKKRVVNNYKTPNNPSEHIPKNVRDMDDSVLDKYIKKEKNKVVRHAPMETEYKVRRSNTALKTIYEDNVEETEDRSPHMNLTESTTIIMNIPSKTEMANIMKEEAAESRVHIEEMLDENDNDEIMNFGESAEDIVSGMLDEREDEDEDIRCTYSFSKGVRKGTPCGKIIKSGTRCSKHTR